MLLNSIRLRARNLAAKIMADVRLDLSNGYILYATTKKSYLHNCFGRGIYAEGTAKMDLAVERIYLRNNLGSFEMAHFSASEIAHFFPSSPNA